jgi:hypothetical protein
MDKIPASPSQPPQPAQHISSNALTPEESLGTQIMGLERELAYKTFHLWQEQQDEVGGTEASVPQIVIPELRQEFQFAA